MTSSDKTRQKLVDSMRMTKSASQKETGEVAAPAGDGTRKSSGAKPRGASKKTARGARKPSPAAVKESLPDTSPRVDNYRSGPRVWPD